MIKIVRVIARLNVGGPARHVVWLSEALSPPEFETVLVAGSVPEGEHDMAYFADQHGVSPVYLSEMSRAVSPLDAIAVYKLFRIFLKEKPDVVHTHTAKAGTVGRIAARMYRWLTPSSLIGRPRKIKVVHTFHGHVFHSYYGRAATAAFVLIEKLLARLATDKIVVISSQQLSEIHYEVGIGRREQFETIPLGIDLSQFESANAESRVLFRRELAVDDDTTVVTFVGRLTEIKNVPMLIEAAGLTQNAATRLHFAIVGDGHLRGELEASVKGSPVAKAFTFLGRREDLASVYAGTDILALTSLNEGTPLSVIEAMAAGRACIATSVGGVVDLLGPEVEQHVGFTLCERGIAVASGDPEGFAKGLLYLAKNEKLRIELATAGSAFANENYGKDRLIGDVRELYQSLLRS